MCARRCTARISRRSAWPRRIATEIGAPNERARTRSSTPIKAVLNDAIKAGGSSLRDHRQTDGELGYFQHSFRVYDREGDEMPDAGLQGHDQAHRAGDAVDVFLSGVSEVILAVSPRPAQRGESASQTPRTWPGEGASFADSRASRRLAPRQHALQRAGKDSAAHAFTYTACCVTTKSTRPSRSACRHSSGRLTIGSSCTLKLVLISTGSPVASRKRRRIAANSGLSSSRTICGRAVPSTCTTAGMRARHSGLHAAGDGHEMRRVAVDVGDLEHARGVLLQHIGRERHELGAVEPLVEVVVDGVVVRARDDRAGAERARAELHAAGIDRARLAGANQIDRGLDRRARRAAACRRPAACRRCGRR